MLDSFEINNLEKNWDKYHMRQNKIKLLALIALALIVSLSFGLIYMINSASNCKEKLTKQILENEKIKKELEVWKMYAGDVKEQLATSKSEKVETDKKEEKEKATEPSEATSKPSKVNNKHLDLKSIPLDLSALEAPKTISNNYKPKSIIEIKSKEVELSVPYLREKFEKTGNLKFAVLLAEKYYNAKDYQNALRWAYTINDLDKDLEDGWIIFAKAMYKTGKKAEAKKVMEAYKEKNPSSKKIDILIRQMQTNTLE